MLIFVYIVVGMGSQECKEKVTVKEKILLNWQRVRCEKSLFKHKNIKSPISCLATIYEILIVTQ